MALFAAGAQATEEREGSRHRQSATMSPNLESRHVVTLSHADRSSAVTCEDGAGAPDRPNLRIWAVHVTILPRLSMLLVVLLGLWNVEEII